MMHPDSTPEHHVAAEAAYKAYADVLAPLAPWGTPHFTQLPDIHRLAWKAVVQAVYDAHAELQPRTWTSEKAASIVEEINARERASLEALRRQVEEDA